MLELISSSLIGKSLTAVLDKAVSEAERFAKFNKKRFVVHKKDLDTAANTHLEKVNEWSSGVSFLYGIEKDIQDLVVELEYFDTRRANHSSQADLKIRSTIYDLIDRERSKNLVIYGEPGSGKTTTLKFLVRKILTDEKFLPDYQFPIVIKLRELNLYNEETTYPSFGVLKYITSEFGIDLYDNHKGEFIDSYIDLENQKVIIEFLNKLNAVIFLDGYDELSKESRSIVNRDLQALSVNLRGSKIVLTSRTGTTHNIFHPSLNCQICPLDEERVRQLTTNWFANDIKKGEKFLKSYENNPIKKILNKPLFLVYLCTLYEKNYELPVEPKYLYEKCVNLLIDAWDKSTAFSRKSEYDNFTTEKKVSFLKELAYELTVFTKQTIFSKGSLSSVFYKIKSKYGLSSIENSGPFFEDLESQTGVFIRTSVDKYEFVHSSFQDFLTASFLINDFDLIENLDINENPFIVSLLIDLSNDPSKYFTKLIFEILIKSDFDDSFFSTLFESLDTLGTRFVSNSELGLAFLCLYTKAVYRDSNNRKKSSLDLFLNYKVFQSSIQATIKSIYKIDNRNIIIYTTTLQNKLDLGNRERLVEIFEKENCDFTVNLSFLQDRDYSKLNLKYYDSFPEYLVCKKRWLRRDN